MYSRRCFLVLGGMAVLYLLAGCSSLPRPTSSSSSLLVLAAEIPGTPGAPVSDRIVIGGPRTVNVDLAHASSGISLVQLLPGHYRVLSRTIRWPGGGRSVVRSFSGAEVDIAPGTVVLPKWRFADPLRGGDASRNGVVPTGPMDRRRAAAKLKDYVRISDWAGRSVTGFAPYSPFVDYSATEYNVRVETTPSDAQIVIDGQTWGNTPLTVNLAPGKHFLRLTRSGYRPHASFISIKANATERIALTPASSGGRSQAGTTATVLIEPFTNLGGAHYDTIAAVLTSSLAVALRHDGIEVIDNGAQGPKGASSGAGPTAQEFSRAEAAGAQAFVAGDYTATGRSILIHAALYDTRTRLVRASVLFEGEGGVSLFDSIDRMSARLGGAVEKALPDVGKAVVKERVIAPRSLVFNKRVHEEAVIRDRNKKRYAVSIGPALAGVMDEVADPSNPTTTNGRINGPGLGIDAGLDIPISGALSLHLATMPILFTDAASKLKVELPLYFGPRYTFSGFMSDVYMGLQGAVHFAPSSAVSFNSGSSTQTTATVGPFWLMGLNFETGVRIYTYRRLSSPPSFLGFGLRLGLFGYRFDLNLTNGRRYPMEVALRIYWGTRL